MLHLPLKNVSDFFKFANLNLGEHFPNLNAWKAEAMPLRLLFFRGDNHAASLKPFPRKEFRHNFFDSTVLPLKSQ